MPDLLVKSSGVRSAMSFICGLSTMATFSEPPPDPPPSSSSSPQPASTSPTSSAAIDPRRTIPFIDLLLLHGRGRPRSSDLRLIALDCVGCQAETRLIRIQTDL